MSAAQWRKAMNSGAQAQAWPRQRRIAPAAASGASPPPPAQGRCPRLRGRTLSRGPNGSGNGCQRGT